MTQAFLPQHFAGDFFAVDDCHDRQRHRGIDRRAVGDLELGNRRARAVVRSRPNGTGGPWRDQDHCGGPYDECQAGG